MLAVFVVLLMFSWVIGDSLRSLLGGSGNPGGGRRMHASDVAVQWDDGKLTNQQVEQLVYRRKFLNSFLQQVEIAGTRSAFAAGVDPTQLRVQRLLGAETPQEGVEQSVVQTKLFADAARESGMKISDETLRQYLFQLGRGRVTPQEMRSFVAAMRSRGMNVTIDDLLSALREEMLAKNFINSNQYAFGTVTPQQRWKDWLRVNERVIVEAAAVPTDSFLVDVKDPTDDELKDFFEKYKMRDAQPDRIGTTELPSATPGFRIPRKIDVAFLEANFDSYVTKAEEKVTDEQIAKFYEENKDRMFIKADTSLFEDKPAPKNDSKVDSKTSDKAATDVPEGSASPATTTPANEGKGEATKSDNGAKSNDAPKSDGEPKSGAAPAKDGKQSSVNGLRVLNPFSLTAFLQEEKADTAKADSAKSDGAKGEAAKSDATPPVTSTSPPAIAPPANAAASAADSAALAAPAAPKKPVEYQPLDQVKDQIRRRIAEENAAEELNKLMSQIQGELQVDFEKYLNLVFVAESETKERPAAPKSLTDLAPIAEKYGLKSGLTGPMSYLQLRETPVGKSRVADLNAPLVDWLFSGREPDLYEPRLTVADIDGNRFLMMKTSDTPGKVPELAEVRDEVIKAWKAQKAAEIAEKNAKELAKKAQEAKTPLTTFFTDKPEIKVARTDLFSELTGGDIGIVNGQFARQPYRLSQPDGIVAPGPAFMKEVFSLKDGDVGAVLNNDGTIAYVIRLVEHQPPMGDLRTAYLAEANNWPGLYPMLQGHAQEVAMNLAEDLTTNANIDWKRTPDKIERGDDTESDSGG